MENPDHGMSHPFKGPGAVAMVWQALTMHRWSASSFSVFVFTDKNVEGWRHALLDRTSKTKCQQRCGNNW